MLQDVIQQSEQLLIEEGISSPIAAEILDFCDDGELFSEALRNSEVSSCSGGGSGGVGCCYDDNSFPSTFSMDPSALSTLLDAQTPPPEPEAGINSNLNYPWVQVQTPASEFPVPPYQSDTQDQFDQIALTDLGIDVYSGYSSESIVPLMVSQLLPPMALPQASLPPVFEEDCVSSLPAYMGMDPSPSSSCSFVDPSICAFFPGNMSAGLLSGDGLGNFPGRFRVRPELGVQSHELVDYQAESGGVGVYGPESTQRLYNSCSCDVQVVGDNQHFLSSCGSPTPLGSEMSTLEESNFKVGRLSVEERKEKIHRYMKKRNERNFSKKIKYACRKTLADSRPRVRGRFAKNDEFGEPTRPSSSNHEDEDEGEVMIKEEDDMMMGSSDIYAHISGVNSFKCNYTLESWI